MSFPRRRQRMLGHRQMIRSQSPICMARLEIEIEVVYAIILPYRVKKFDGIHLDANRQWWRVRHRMVVHVERSWRNIQNRKIELLLAQLSVGEGAS